MILSICLKKGFNVVGVCCPLDDKYIRPLAAKNEIPIIPAGMLNGDTFPNGVDLGITAHSFDYVGKRTRYKAKLGWIGYHPSLLPLHRGKSAVQWAIKMRESVTGGTVFWLNSGIDRGDIAYQDFTILHPKYFSLKLKVASSRLWRDKLQPMGLNLMSKALDDISSGVIIKNAQDESLSTFEPSMVVTDIYKPDLLMIE
ncbi:formyltransferase family protein [Tenacibaculum finnmarkense]|nr:formyltransferase family protein [Tenacibaculum finnmarkense]MCG8808429.1 methionyl-tRNA formyltransferase [Tenacibaculum finnmarkense]MCG8818749.1 methionyl-tRNA formyltransferase [Tenacibaculum finnmarkense]